MPYHLFAKAHLLALAFADTARRERGQGTVEYVGLILLLAVLFAAVASKTRDKDAGITDLVTNKLKDAINQVKHK